MLGMFKWCHELVTLLLKSDKFEIDDLECVEEAAEHYYNTNLTPTEAHEQIMSAWPDISFHVDDVEEPEATPEDEKESQEDLNPKPHAQPEK